MRESFMSSNIDDQGHKYYPSRSCLCYYTTNIMSCNMLHVILSQMPDNICNFIIILIIKNKTYSFDRDKKYFKEKNPFRFIFYPIRYNLTRRKHYFRNILYTPYERHLRINTRVVFRLEITNFIGRTQRKPK